MIRSVPELRSLSTDVIKIAQNTDPTKTQGKRLLGLITDILDTVDDLVLQQGLSISSNMQSQRTEILQMISNNLTGINDSIASYVSSHMPDLSTYLKSSDTIPYNKLSGVPIILTYDLSIYQKLADTIPYTRLTGVPTSFDGDYTKLINKPNIPTYDLSLYKLKSDAVDYNTIVNKPSISKLLWNQITPTPVNNTVSELNILTTGKGSLMLDANTEVGSTFRISGRGVFSTQTITVPNLTIKLYLGTTKLAEGTVSSFLLGANNKTFGFSIDILVVSTNTIYAQGYFSYYAGLTDTLSSTPILNGTGANSTLDMSISNQLKMTYAWSLANSSNQISTKIVNFEKLN